MRDAYVHDCRVSETSPQTPRAWPRCRLNWQASPSRPLLLAGIAGWLLLLNCTAIVRSTEPPPQTDSKATASDLVHAALLAEVEGDRESRRSLIQQAIQKGSNSPLAHWYAGEIFRDGRWQSLEAVQRQAASDKRLAEYRTLRDQQASVPGGQLALARWCNEHGMADIGRIHWIRVAMAEPDHAEALTALDDVWSEGQLVTRAQLKQAQAEQKQARSRLAQERQSITRWTAPVAVWRRELKEGKAEAKEAIRTQVQVTPDPLAAHSLGTVMINGSRQKSDPKGFLMASLALIEALDQSQQPSSAIELARHAVEHPTLEVRNAAADALRKRDKLTYVPWLLAQFRYPIEATILVSPLSFNNPGVTIYQTFEQEGPNSVSRYFGLHHVLTDVPKINVDITRYVRRGYTEKTTTTNVPQVVASSWREATARVANTRNTIERLNAKAGETNTLVLAALQRATGEKIEADRGAWEQWWKKYHNNYYELESGDSEPPIDEAYPSPGQPRQPATPQKPVVEYWEYSGAPFLPIGYSVIQTVSYSCFPWNTKVWTETGPVNISDLKPGDRVLSQHPYSGKLDFQPVLEVTRRNPSPMIEIDAGGETIRTTRGHPFWVCGRGWKMAKELEAGMLLHTVDGPVRIERVAPAPPAKPWYQQDEARPSAELSYNLVLEDYHNYFVGQQKVLVHDNTLFPNDGPVPGVPGLTAQ